MLRRVTARLELGERLVAINEFPFARLLFACGKQFVPDIVERLAGGEKAVPAAGAAEGAPSAASGGESEKHGKPWWKIW